MIVALLLLALSPLLMMNLIFIAEMLWGLLPTRQRANAEIGSPLLSQATIIIPAHDEAVTIGQTLQRLVDATDRAFPILVVADNCSDSTAAIARQHGAQVIERHDPERRGKGFALDFARQWLRSSPPTAVIILDADCWSDGSSLRGLAAASNLHRVPAQAINLLEPSPSASAMVQLSTFAFFIKNKIRQRGLQRLSGGVHLTGTGMCLPWALFDSADLATESIVEDVRLGLELGSRGAHPILVEQSLVWSPHAALDSTLTQRSRWEGGFLSLARRTVPAMLIGALRQRKPALLVGALDLAVPPLALLALLNGAALLLTILLAWSGLVSWTPVLAVAAIGGASLLLILLAWWREGRVFLSASALLRIPAYVLWKIPMYAGLARKGAPKVWRRTDRSGETGP